MSNFFGNLHGARFPDVVMNSGPLPPSGGLPAPLHDTPDGKINYNSTLLGDLQPYAYGEPAYQSSQNAYLNTPHRIQKIVPLLFLPEPNGTDLFRLSHAIDDSDLAFVMRLNRQSIFCTGTKVASRRTGLGTVIDPFVNLATLNYLLAGIQHMPAVPDKKNLWWELLFNLDPNYWPELGKHRNYLRRAEEDMSEDKKKMTDEELFDHYRKEGSVTQSDEAHKGNAEPLTLSDLVHFVKKCVRPFGIVRGSEKQGGQSEMTNSPATWPVPAIATLVIDGKEANIVNIWLNQNVHAGDDLVLRFKLMPIGTYTLNHYYKGFVRKSFDTHSSVQYAWQLVPDVYSLEIPDKCLQETMDRSARFLSLERSKLDFVKKRHFMFLNTTIRTGKNSGNKDSIKCSIPICDQNGLKIHWQEIGFWHIGRSQVMMSSYGTDDFYNNDMANSLKTNHMEMTFQPMFSAFPIIASKIRNDPDIWPITRVSKQITPPKKKEWNPSLMLETKYIPSQQQTSTTTKKQKTEWNAWEHDDKKDDPWGIHSFEETKQSDDTKDDPWGIHSFEKTKQVSWEARPIIKTVIKKEPEEANTTSVPTVIQTPIMESKNELQEDEKPPEETKPTEEEIALSIPTPGLNSNNKKTQARPKGRKPGGNNNNVVEGTLLKPGAAAESCTMQLL